VRTVGEALAQARLPVRHVVSSHVAAVLAVVVGVRNELKGEQEQGGVQRRRPATNTQALSTLNATDQPESVSTTKFG
jgi:hypothetical protein